MTFPLTEKVDVNGEARHPLYQQLTAQPDAEGEAGDIQWNFEKFLVSPAGEVVARFRPRTEPESAEVIRRHRSDPARLSGQPAGPVVVVRDPGDARLDPYRHLTDAACRVGLDAAARRVRRRRRAGASASCSRPTGSRHSLLLRQPKCDALPDLVAAAARHAASRCTSPAPAILSDVAGFPVHRGVLALGRPPGTSRSASTLWRHASLVAILEGINDHENLGALFRNAAAFGLDACLLDPTTADPLYRRAIRVSVGHVLRVPFARLRPWPDGVSDLRAGRASPSLRSAPAATRPSMTWRWTWPGGGWPRSSAPKGRA